MSLYFSNKTGNILCQNLSGGTLAKLNVKLSTFFNPFINDG